MLVIQMHRLYSCLEAVCERGEGDCGGGGVIFKKDDTSGEVLIILRPAGYG